MKFSIQLKIVCSIFFVLVLPLLIIYLYSYNNIEKIMIDTTKQYTVSMLSHTDRKIENMLNNLINISELICNDTGVVDSIKANSDVQPFDKLIKILRVEDIIRNVRNTQLSSRYQYDIFVLTDTNQFFGSIANNQGSYLTKEQFSTVSAMKSSNWYNELKTSVSYFKWIAPHENYIYSSSDSYISLCRSIYDPITFDFLGALIVSISVEDFQKDISVGLQDDGTAYYIFNEFGEVIYLDKNKSEIQRANAVYKIAQSHDFNGENVEDVFGKKFLIATNLVQKNGWRIIYEVPLDKVFLEIYNTKNKHLFTMEGLLLIFSILMVLIVNKIIKPIRQLKNAMNSVSEGNFDIHVNVNSSDEFSSLAKTFNSMSLKVKELVGEIEEKQKIEQKLKFEVLHSQINPHFLLNSLNTIRLSAEMSQSYNISKMITELGKLLKYSINIKTDKIAIKEEIEYLQSYVYLYNIRYNNGIKLNIDINEDLYNEKVLKMILQPFVENSIIHGFDNKGFGNISISISKENNNLCIVVADDGKGLSLNLLKELDEILEISETYSARYTRVGIKNVQDRLYLKYGAQSKLTIESNEGAGTKIVFKLPKDSEENSSGTIKGVIR